jgi:hypothetical protein
MCTACIDEPQKRGVEVGALQQAAHYAGGERVGADFGQRAFLREVERRAGVGGNDGFHEGLQWVRKTTIQSVGYEVKKQARRNVPPGRACSAARQ